MKEIGNYDIDFIIPLHKNNILFSCVIESIVKYYKPRNIYIITSMIEINKLKNLIFLWDIKKTMIKFICEEFFFEYHYHKSIEKIKKWYTYIDEKSREFGWWYQQILKLGIVYRIKDLSCPYIIWDADLIPLQQWTIYPSLEIPHFHFALLQETEKNEFNQKQYEDSLFELLKLSEICPHEIGTFVPHHFVFYPNIIKCFIKYIEKIHNCTYKNPWFRVIIELSKKYYRFSEYKNIATFMSYFFPEKLHYHYFICYGKNGIRIRDSHEAHEFIEKLKKHINKSYVSYEDFVKFMFLYEKYLNCTYIQVEHLTC